MAKKLTTKQRARRARENQRRRQRCKDVLERSGPRVAWANCYREMIWLSRGYGAKS